MSHLSLETMARLVDEAPNALEAAHLAVCDACRAELQELHEQTARLSALPMLEPPADQWEEIERRLVEEGLIRIPARRNRWLFHGARAAAAVLLLATGMLLGRSLNTTSPATSAPLLVSGSPADSPAPATAAVPAAAEPEILAAAEPEPAPPQDDVREQRDVARDVAPGRLVGYEVRPPRTADEALALLRAAELDYLDALTLFAELSGSTGAGDPAARLAALEGIVLTTRAALGQAPTDPVINGYHLTALAQRDATLRQIAATSTESWF